MKTKTPAPETRAVASTTESGTVVETKYAAKLGGIAKMFGDGCEHTVVEADGYCKDCGLKIVYEENKADVMRKFAKTLSKVAKSEKAGKNVAPKAVAPKAVAPKAVAPKAVAPKPVAPKPTENGTLKGKQLDLPLTPPKTDNHNLLEKFSFAFVQMVNGAYGYQHADGRAVVLGRGGLWQLKSPDKEMVSGDTTVMLEAALDLTEVEPTEKVEKLMEKAKAKGKYMPDTPVVPAHVVRAVEILGGMTLQRFSLESLATDKHYKQRVTLLKTLLKTEKVLVRDSRLAHLVDVFYSAVGVGDGKTKAAKTEEFVRRCRAIAATSRVEKTKAKREEQELIKRALRATVAERTVPGTILPGGKPMTKKQHAQDLAEAKDKLRSQLVLSATEGPVAQPRPAADIIVVPADIQLLEDPKNGVVMLQLERTNSQGAICVYNNGQRVSAGVIPPETLRKLRPVPGVDLLQAANQLLNPIVPTVPVTTVAVRHLTAVIHCKEMKSMTSANENKNPKFAAPEAAAKKSAKAAKPAKKAAKKSSTKAETRSSRHAAEAKIKGIKPNPLREGTFCWAQVEAVNKSKTLGEAQDAILKDKKHNPNGRGLEVGWLTKKGYLTVA